MNECHYASTEKSRGICKVMTCSKETRWALVHLPSFAACSNRKSSINKFVGTQFSPCAINVNHSHLKRKIHPNGISQVKDVQGTIFSLRHWFRCKHQISDQPRIRLRNTENPSYAWFTPLVCRLLHGENLLSYRHQLEMTFSVVAPQLWNAPTGKPTFMRQALNLRL